MKKKGALKVSVLLCALGLTIVACGEVSRPLPEVGTLDEYAAFYPVVSLDKTGRIPIQDTPYNNVVGDCTDTGQVPTISNSCLTIHLSTAAGPGFVAY